MPYNLSEEQKHIPPLQHYFLNTVNVPMIHHVLSAKKGMAKAPIREHNFCQLNTIKLVFFRKTYFSDGRWEGFKLQIFL